MKKLCVILLIICASVTSLFAQNTFDKFVNFINNSKSISLQFTLSIKETSVKSAVMSGRIDMTKTSYRFEMGDIEMYNDGKTFVSYNSSVNEATIFDASEDEANPQKLLNMFDKCDSKMISEEGNLVTYRVLPLEKTTYKELVVSVNKTNNHITNMIVKGAGVESYTIDIEDFVVDMELPETLFSFKSDRHPGVEVVDMR